MKNVKIDRDTQKFAMKCSAICVNGEWRDVFKQPITDAGKTSKKGRVTLWESGGKYISSVEQPKEWTDKGFEWKEALETYYKDGESLFAQTFDQVRSNSML